MAALMSATMFAAETEYLPISVYAMQDVEPFPQGAKALVENKLTQLLTRNGIAGIDYMGQFVLTVTTTPLDKDVIAGPPAKIAEKMELNFYIVDAYAKTIFSSASLTVRGLGETGVPDLPRRGQGDQEQVPVLPGRGRHPRRTGRGGTYTCRRS